MTPTLVLTRPEPQSREIAAALGTKVKVVIAPVMRIAGAGVQPDLAPYRGVILTSANAVKFAPDLTGTRAYCVGKRTAEAARKAGAEVLWVAQDADDLVSRRPGPGPLVHLRGEHSRGDVAKRLSSAGTETDEAVIYRQEARPLGAEAVALIEGKAPVVLPLFSPRSAMLVARGIAHIGSRVHVIAMSQAVKEAWQAATGHDAEVLAEPTSAEMHARIAAALRG